MMRSFASKMNPFGTGGARIQKRNVASRGGRGTDVFRSDGGDVSKDLAPNWRRLKFGDVFYGEDGNLYLILPIVLGLGGKLSVFGPRWTSRFVIDATESMWSNLREFSQLIPG